MLAENPSGMTLDGTNSWVLRAPGQRGCVVVDPGPDDARHLDRLAEQGPVELILLTHHHLDHSEGARAFSERTGAPVRALDPQLCLGRGGARRRGGPGRGGARHPRGGDAWTHHRLAVLRRRRRRQRAHRGHRAGPGHDRARRPPRRARGLPALPGPARRTPGGDDAAARATARTCPTRRRPRGTTSRTVEQRLEQVREALHRLGEEVTPRQVVEVVYADVDESLWPAADLSVAAQLAQLREYADGRADAISERGAPGGPARG